MFDQCKLNDFLKGVLFTDVVGWISLQRFLSTSRTLQAECLAEVRLYKRTSSGLSTSPPGGTLHCYVPFACGRSAYYTLSFFSKGPSCFSSNMFNLSQRQHSECHGHLGTTVQPSSQQKHLECVSRSCLMGYEALSYFFYKLSTRMRRF